MVCVLVSAHAEEASEGHHGIGDPAAEIFDPQSLDSSDIVSVAVVYSGAPYRSQSAACPS